MRLRAEIAKAEAVGAPREDMRLQLTLNDVSALKRDGNRAVEGVGFWSAGMTFLGVRIMHGGVATSLLTYPEQLSR